MKQLVRLVMVLVLGLCAFAATTVPNLAEETMTEARKAEIEKIVRDYLIANPEVIREALIALEKKQAAAQQSERSETIARNRDKIFNSRFQVVVGNPDGDVTLVEFFDYNCPYCKRALSDMMDLVKGDPKLRVVLKEFPVLGRGSIEAAQVAIAVAKQGKYLEFHKKLLSQRGRADKARALEVARSLDIDMDKLKADMETDLASDTISEVYALANSLGIGGTPAYVIGDEVVEGAVGFATLKEKIDAVRQCGMATC